MELFVQMLCQEIEKGNIQITLSGEVAKIIESKTFLALEQIKNIVRDDSLSDPECFMKIEEIINVLEEMGSGGGLRHDFG